MIPFIYGGKLCVRFLGPITRTPD
uniref:Uncharacterized protein n=1 Tax=Anguilla anguilla TaxID=7936 RepID=A0A0E9P6E8_ANGAN